MSTMKGTLLRSSSPDYSEQIELLKAEISQWKSETPRASGELASSWDSIYRHLMDLLLNYRCTRDVFIISDSETKIIQGVALCRADTGYHISYLLTAPWNLVTPGIKDRKWIGSKLMLMICHHALRESYSHISVVPAYTSSTVDAFYRKFDFESGLPPAEQFQMALPAFKFPLAISKLWEHETELQIAIEYTGRETLGTGVPWILSDIKRSQDENGSPAPLILFQELCRHMRKPLQNHEEEYIDRALMHLTREMTIMTTRSQAFDCWIYNKYYGGDCSEFTIQDDHTPHIRIPAYNYYSQRRRTLLDEIFCYFIFLNIKMKSNPCSVNLEKYPISKVLTELGVPVSSKQIFPEQLAEIWLQAAANLLFCRERRLAFQRLLQLKRNPWGFLFITELLVDKKNSKEGQHLVSILSGYFALLHATGQSETLKLVKHITAVTNPSDESMPFIKTYQSMIDSEQSFKTSAWSQVSPTRKRSFEG